MKALVKQVLSIFYIYYFIDIIYKLSSLYDVAGVLSLTKYAAGNRSIVSSCMMMCWNTVRLAGEERINHNLKDE